eukprot:SAG31_NODE_5914_length_2258_cov_2.765632_2_plen_197_part_00
MVTAAFMLCASGGTAQPPPTYCDPTTSPPQFCPPISPGGPDLKCPNCGTIRCPCPLKPLELNISCIPPRGTSCTFPGCSSCCKSELRSQDECMQCINAECDGVWLCNAVLEQQCGSARNGSATLCGKCIGEISTELRNAANCTTAEIEDFCGGKPPSPPKYDCNNETLQCVENVCSSMSLYSPVTSLNSFATFLWL